MEVRMTMKKEALTSQHPTSVVLADNLGRLSEAALPKMMSLSRKVQIWRRKELDAPPNPLGWANFDVPLHIRDFEGEDFLKLFLVILKMEEIQLFPTAILFQWSVRLYGKRRQNLGSL